jgi:hypothetical protein
MKTHTNKPTKQIPSVGFVIDPTQKKYLTIMLKNYLHNTVA